MEVIDKQVHEEKSAVTVEFVGDGGEVVSVHLKKGDDDNLNPLNAEEKAKAIMVQIATFEIDGETDVSHPVASNAASVDDPSTTAASRHEIDDRLDEGLDASVPASDPVSATVSTIASGQANHPNAKPE